MGDKVNELWGDLYKDVKYRNERVNYHAMIFIGGCNYEVLINDFPVDRYFGPGNGSASGSIPINTAILKSGVQTWKIRIYPVHDSKEVNGKVTMVPRPLIEDGARVEMDIEGIRFTESGGIEKRFGKVVDFQAPLTNDERTGKKILADHGKPYVEYTGTFQADVPYRLNGWEQGEDLSKLNKDNLEKELLKKYNEYKGWLQNGDLDKIAKSKLNAEKEEAQALYFNKKLNDQYISEFTTSWGRKNITVQPLENYSLKFYGDGKVVALISNVYKKSPLWASFKDEESNNNYTIYNLYFYIPKGKKELEVIR
ncbi:hypothetical protein M2T82_17145 [Elizabethkingia ursingii]|uniref:hypothetical protein n=1 Tax=Elizabethkingia ursingii TaxID=1756150 RepID=UPI002011AC7F|nr:hypothetical protein [Elizabethkingia ursingii]MCL1669787.1 hypothetical protein [Elizabethkingia ursingii]